MSVESPELVDRQKENDRDGIMGTVDWPTVNWGRATCTLEACLMRRGTLMRREENLQKQAKPSKRIDIYVSNLRREQLNVYRAGL